MKIQSLIQQLEVLFAQSANTQIAQDQAAYMRDQFTYHGIKKPIRAQLQKECFKSYPVADESELILAVTQLWHMPQREYQYAALDLTYQYRTFWTPAILDLFVELILTKSWWDSVDTIASNLVGGLLLKYPELQQSTASWIKHDNMWIRRTALIYQLRYKAKTDHEKLFDYCSNTMHEQEFFIRKAIGWALREYSKTDPMQVRNFIDNHKSKLSSLSIREASKYI